MNVPFAALKRKCLYPSISETGIMETVLFNTKTSCPKNRTLLLFSIGTLLLILFPSIGCYSLHAQPAIPYIQKNICPSECCRYGLWTAKSNLKLNKKEGDSSVVAFTVKSGEKITAIRGNVHVVKLGILVVKKPIKFNNKSLDTFSEGEKIYVLSYGGEGYYDLWHKGKLLDIDLDDSDQIWGNSELVQTPHMIWWVLVKNYKSKKGWLKIDIGDGHSVTEEKVEIMDTCGN